MHSATERLGQRDVVGSITGRHLALLAVRRQALSPSAPPDGAFSPDVCRILRLLHKRAFDSRINVKVLRHEAGARDHNVSSRFKAELGVSITDYLGGLRVGASITLLQDTSVPIAEIAHTVGYEYLQTFYRELRRLVGTTPGTIRRQAHRPEIALPWEQASTATTPADDVQRRDVIAMPTGQ